MPSKQLEAAAQELSSAEQRKRAAAAEVDQARSELERRRAERDSKVALLEARAVVERARAERDRLAAELQEHQQRLAEQQQVPSLRIVRGLRDAAQLSARLRSEVELLAGAAAREAALEAAGGELPSSVVPEPTPLATSALDSQQPDAELEPALADAARSQAAAAAAQRSVVVQAAEIREGLRQWGLARAACARVNAARGELAEAKRSSADRDAQARAECRALLEERQERQRDVAALAADVEARRRQHGRLVERRRAVEDHLEELRTSHVSASRQSEEALRRKAQVSVESAQAGEELESALLALREHEAEASRRRSAARTLTQRAADQVDRGMAELLQTQRQLISFRQAHAALREALKTTTQQLEWEREYEQSLKADHEITNLSLEALASGYLEALHEIAGVEQ